jgi:hypothetical protein
MNINEIGNTKKSILVAGETVEVDKDANVQDTLTTILKSKGIDSFTIVVDGEEITDTNNLPEKFDGHDIEVERYVKPGCIA